MAVANALAYCDMATITTVKSLIIRAPEREEIIGSKIETKII
jgi:hypothetical protein